MPGILLGTLHVDKVMKGRVLSQVEVATSMGCGGALDVLVAGSVLGAVVEVALDQTVLDGTTYLIGMCSYSNILPPSFIANRPYPQFLEGDKK